MSSLVRPSDVEQSAQRAHFGGLVELRPIGIDDWSDVRYVHGSSFRTLIGPQASPEHVEEFVEALGTPEYVDRYKATNLTGAWLGRDLAGTVGWRPSASQGRVARIEGLFVQPLFTFMGLGSLLLSHAEAEARSADFSAATVLATSASLPFFMRLGYDIYVQGAGVGSVDLPLFLLRKQLVATAPVAAVVHEKSRQVPGTAAPEIGASLTFVEVGAHERALAED